MSAIASYLCCGFVSRFGQFEFVLGTSELRQVGLLKMEVDWVFVTSVGLLTAAA